MRTPRLIQGCSAKRKEGLISSTCFEHYYAHLQEDNCISTESGIVTENCISTLFCIISDDCICAASGIVSDDCISTASGIVSDHCISRASGIVSDDCISTVFGIDTDYTKCCTNTTVLLKMSTIVLETSIGE